jgi:hypothetical protein
MTIVIGLLLVIALFGTLVRLALGIESGRRSPARRRPDAEIDPEALDLTRLCRDMAAACDSDQLSANAQPDGAAEHRETQYARELLAAAIYARTYQRLMTDLAHGTTRSGGAR